MPAAHLAPAPATPPPAPGPDWQALSEAMTAQLPADRRPRRPDRHLRPRRRPRRPRLLHPGPGPHRDRRPAPRASTPAPPTPPAPPTATATPPPWGVLTHEAAHATHTRWTGAPQPLSPPPGARPP